jgi:phage gp45-like
MNLEWVKSKLERLEERIGNVAASIVEFTTLARTTSAGDEDQANVAGNPADRQRPVRRTSPWGLAGYPPAGLLSVIVKTIASAFGGAVVGLVDTQYAPQGLKEGETALYGKAGQQLYLDVNGNIIATPTNPNPTPGTVQVGGNSQALPMFQSFEAALADFIQLFAGSGAIVVSSTGAPAPTLSGPASQLVARLRGGVFDSRVARNG